MDMTPPFGMDNRTWYARVSDLVGEACDATVEEEAGLMRKALELLARAPAGQLGRFGNLPSRERFDLLLAAGAGESAALALLPTDAAFIVSRGGNGVCLSSVMLDGDDEEVAAEGASIGLALLAALAGALRIAAPVPMRMSEIAMPTLGSGSGCLH